MKTVTETIRQYLAGELHPQRSLSDVLQQEHDKGTLARHIADQEYAKMEAMDDMIATLSKEHQIVHENHVGC